MLSPFKTFRSDLIAKIKSSSSQMEVKQIIDLAIKDLEKNKPASSSIIRFLDTMLSELESFSPMNKDVQQWSNIKMAMICFKQIKKNLVLRA